MMEFGTMVFWKSVSERTSLESDREEKGFWVILNIFMASLPPLGIIIGTMSQTFNLLVPVLGMIVYGAYWACGAYFGNQPAVSMSKLYLGLYFVMLTIGYIAIVVLYAN